MTLVDSVFPVIGVVLSNALYFAPLPAVISAARSGVLGPSSVLPQAVMVISTTAWVFYALSVPNFYITAANVPGVISSVYAISITLPLIPRDRLREREQVQAVLVGGAAIDLFLWVFLIASEASAEHRSAVLGLYGSLICIVLFASPLATVRDVIATRNSASIYAPLTFAQVINCGTWTAYGLAVGDIWVWGPNAAGFALGLAQLSLKLTYPARGSNEARPFFGAARAAGGKCSDADSDEP